MNEWDSYLSLNSLPESIHALFSEEARSLLSELEHTRLSVDLIPAPDPRFAGHKIRDAVSQNPDWYRHLYRSHSYFRRDRSLRALEAI